MLNTVTKYASNLAFAAWNLQDKFLAPPQGPYPTGRGIYSRYPLPISPSASQTSPLYRLILLHPPLATTPCSNPIVLKKDNWPDPDTYRCTSLTPALRSCQQRCPDHVGISWHVKRAHKRVESRSYRPCEDIHSC